MNTLEVEKQKTERMVRTFRGLKADSNGSLPTRIEILQIGMWDTPYHGMFMIDQNDLNEMKANFDAGVAQSGDGLGVPIDFSHDESGQAAGWIKGMVVEGNSLYADPVEWTGAGKEALLAGNFKCFSPTFYPSCLGGWPDPEDYDTFVPNVITGGALTNIPLFKGLQPIMASVDGGGKDKSRVIYISASAEGKHMPTLEEVKVKDVASLTEEDKKVLADNQASLSTDEKVKFGLEAAPAAPAANENKNEEGKDVTDPETAQIAASIKSGESVVVKASVFNKLQEDVKDMKRKEIAASVDAHIARGAIKADQKEAWTDRILADPTTVELLAAVPSNKLMAAAIGSTDNAIDVTGAQDELHGKVVAAATDPKYKGYSYAQRRTAILAEDKTLATRINEIEEQE